MRARSFTFRVTDGLKAQLVASARASGRSLAGEVVHRLELMCMSDADLMMVLMGRELDTDDTRERGTNVT